MDDLFSKLKRKIQEHSCSIVFPESLDDRILKTICRLSEENILTPVLIGEREKILSSIGNIRCNVNKIVIYDPYQFAEFEELVDGLIRRRKGKISEVEARELLRDENVFATMLVAEGKVNGLISGATHSTAETVQPALQLIKTKRGIQKVSGAFLMIKGDQKYLFADCAINISPTVEDLAEIAIVSAETASIFGIDPKVAMLSFSTKGSANSPEVQKVIAATKLAKERAPHLALDGEFQFDAAFVPEVAAKKAPDSLLKGQANVFVFPDIEAGNICYKAVQRLGGFEAIGPILQGLAKPVNDLSRGCSAEDVYKLSLVTAMQSLTRSSQMFSIH